eukprot:2528943-Prymnesium_polylepis.1
MRPGSVRAFVKRTKGVLYSPTQVSQRTSASARVPCGTHMKGDQEARVRLTVACGPVHGKPPSLGQGDA